MPLDRRKFLATSVAAPLLISDLKSKKKHKLPIIVSTWDFGQKANNDAFAALNQGSSSIDAIVAGIMNAENDEKNQSVGYGGLPDRDGRVTLDACIMNHDFRCGSVIGLEHIRNPIKVAKMVMEKTPHVYLYGDGALDFALANGERKENLLISSSEKAWKEWLKKAKYLPKANIENKHMKVDKNNHDTIGMILLDKNQKLAGGCSTSGLAFKMHGRVGDSPIIGSGLFVDGDVGACTGTGLGEEVIRISSAAIVVELMRQGKSPQKAVEEVIKRIAKNTKIDLKDLQVGLIAINLNGEIGAYAIQPGFTYALRTEQEDIVLSSKSLI